MYIKCIDNDGIAKNRLTLFKEYKVIEKSDSQMFKIKEDNGDETYWKMERFVEDDTSAMELRANKEQTIEVFAEELMAVSEVAFVYGIFNNIRINVNIWDNPDSLVKQYNDRLNGKY